MDLFNNLQSRTVKKGTTLLRQGDFCNEIYSVLKGCLKSYVIDKTGKEHILQFAPEGWFISELNSYFNNKPAAVFIDAIEDSEIFPLNKSALNNIEGQSKEALMKGNEKLVSNIIQLNKRLISLLSATAEERYIEFTQIYPNLVQRLPQKLIASYIGITPEYLSEIRKKSTKK